MTVCCDYGARDRFLEHSDLFDDIKQCLREAKTLRPQICKAGQNLICDVEEILRDIAWSWSDREFYNLSRLGKKALRWIAADTTGRFMTNRYAWTTSIATILHRIDDQRARGEIKPWI